MLGGTRPREVRLVGTKLAKPKMNKRQPQAIYHRDPPIIRANTNSEKWSSSVIKSMNALIMPMPEKNCQLDILSFESQQGVIRLNRDVRRVEIGSSLRYSGTLEPEPLPIEPFLVQFAFPLVFTHYGFIHFIF